MLWGRPTSSLNPRLRLDTCWDPQPWSPTMNTSVWESNNPGLNPSNATSGELYTYLSLLHSFRKHLLRPTM